MKQSRTKQIEEKYGVKLHRGYAHFLTSGGCLNYDIEFKDGSRTCEWLETLDAVEKYIEAKNEPNENQST